MYTLKELIELLLNVRKLPTMPNVAMMLINSFSENEPDVGKISKIIADDPPLTGMTLKMANSVYYGARRQIGTVQDAVMRLGFKELRKLVIDISLVKYISELPEGQMKPVAYWEHSIGAALAMEILQERHQILDSNGTHAHVAGLLHDIGRMITATHMPEVHQQLFPESEHAKSLDPIVPLEKERIGLDHSQIGAAVLERWGLPLEIVNCIRYHHQPGVAPKPQRKMTFLIYAADNLCRWNEIGDTGEGRLRKLDPETWKYLGISHEELIDVEDEVKEKVRGSEVMLSISGLADRT